VPESSQAENNAPCDGPLAGIRCLRERYGLEVFRRFFAAIVEQCVAAGLVWGKGL
jgi:hypothetical protein